MKFKNIFSLIYISTLALAVPVADTEESNEIAEYCSKNKHSTSIFDYSYGNKVDTKYDFNYEIWHNNGGSSGTCYFYNDGSFGYSLEGCTKCLCTYGLSFDGDKTHERIGHLYADFKFVRDYGGNSYDIIQNVDYSYVGIHGWGRDSQNSQNSLIEFYIVDYSLNDNGTGDWEKYKHLGDTIIDGARYSVYEYNAVKDSSSYGADNSDTTFTKIFSIRNNPRDCGTIDITAHFRQWEEKLNIKLGILKDAKFIIESHSNDANNSGLGRGDFTYAKIYIKPKRKCIIWNQKN